MKTITLVAKVSLTLLLVYVIFGILQSVVTAVTSGQILGYFAILMIVIVFIHFIWKNRV